MEHFYDAIRLLAGGQVYALVAPEDTQYPALVYTPIAQELVLGLDGPLGLQRLRVQVDAYARTLQEALYLQDQVLAALVAADSALVDVRLGLTDFEPQARLYRVSVDYTQYVPDPFPNATISTSPENL